MSEHRSIRDAVWACRAIGSAAKMVALRLVEHWPRALPSLAELSEWTGMSESTVRRAVQELEDASVISVNRRNGWRSIYEFVGVSIPDLGGRNPRQFDTPSTVTPLPGRHPFHGDTPVNGSPPLSPFPLSPPIPPSLSHTPFTPTPTPTNARSSEIFPTDPDHQPDQVDLCARETGDATALHRESEAGREKPDCGPETAPGSAFQLTEAPKPKAKAKRPVSPFALPDDFAPNATCRALAERLQVDLSAELEAFVDHHVARRNRFVDWQAALRTWIRNAVKYGDTPKSGTRARGPDTPLQRQADRIRMLREQEAEEERRKAAGGGK